MFPSIRYRLSFLSSFQSDFRFKLRNPVESFARFVYRSTNYFRKRVTPFKGACNTYTHSSPASDPLTPRQAKPRIVTQGGKANNKPPLAAFHHHQMFFTHHYHQPPLLFFPHPHPPKHLFACYSFLPFLLSRRNLTSYFNNLYNNATTEIQYCIVNKSLPPTLISKYFRA